MGDLEQQVAASIWHTYVCRQLDPLHRSCLMPSLTFYNPSHSSAGSRTTSEKEEEWRRRMEEEVGKGR